jgi:hypothetical protein
MTVPAAVAAPCSVWPDRLLRVNTEGASNLLFILRTRPGADVAQVGGLFRKLDPKGQCAPGSRSAACRNVGVWSEYPAIEVDSPAGLREDSLSLYLGSSVAPFLYEGVFYVRYADGSREWLNNPGDAKRNFWFTQESTASLPQSASWDFDLLRVARTADIGHWSNPDRCR